MTLQVSHPVVDWYLAFDDLWELLRVNWQTHNTFTQAGMWDANDCHVHGVVAVIDAPPNRSVLLAVRNGDGEDDFLLVATYGPRCQECSYQPHNSLWFGDNDMDGALGWFGGASAAMFDNAEGGVERLHNDECSHLTYPDDDDPDD
jgi:hypothetical protein